MDINKTNESVKDDLNNNLEEKYKELWIFQYNNESNIDQKYIERLTGIINFKY